MSAQDFWNDTPSANKVLVELKYAKSCVEPYEKSIKKLADLKELSEMSAGDEEMLGQIATELSALEEDIKKLETSAFLSGEFDRSNVIFSINAGAGGTESCDWANMLLRMYTRWAEDNNCKVKVLDILAGEGAGIKNATLSIEGEMVYGYLKGEKGVHRLVRISPFDSNARRHTSFASAWVYPVVDDTIQIDINEKDLRIDTYRASGAGGQHVNKTDSAVRITHIPTGIVVSCQNDRSQHKNRATAWAMLRSRLYEFELEKREAKIDALNATKTDIGWGHQIRSYVLQPYQLVKDLRTGMQSYSPQNVLDGDLDAFMQASLSQRIKGGADAPPVEDLE